LENPQLISFKKILGEFYPSHWTVALGKPFAHGKKTCLGLADISGNFLPWACLAMTVTDNLLKASFVCKKKKNFLKHFLKC